MEDKKNKMLVVFNNGLSEIFEGFPGKLKYKKMGYDGVLMYEDGENGFMIVLSNVLYIKDL